MNTTTTRSGALGILVLISMLAFSGCSQKTSSEEIAAQVKAAMAEEKAKEQTAAPAAATKVTSPKAATKTRSIEHAKPVQPEPAAPAKKIYCANCGEVISVKAIELAGKGSGLGVVVGGVAGGLLGNQVGQGSGRDLATIAGLVGGAFAGNKIEEKVKKTQVYDVTVRMENGEERILRYKTVPGVLAGDKVRVEGEQIVRL